MTEEKPQLTIDLDATPPATAPLKHPATKNLICKTCHNYYSTAYHLTQCPARIKKQQEAKHDLRQKPPIYMEKNIPIGADAFGDRNRDIQEARAELELEKLQWQREKIKIEREREYKLLDRLGTTPTPTPMPTPLLSSDLSITNKLLSLLDKKLTSDSEEPEEKGENNELTQAALAALIGGMQNASLNRGTQNQTNPNRGQDGENPNDYSTL